MKFTSAESPNRFDYFEIFEFWFIGISLYKFRNKIINAKSITFILVIATILKLLQEWVLHWNKYLDNYAMGDILSVIKDGFFHIIF